MRTLRCLLPLLVISSCLGCRREVPPPAVGVDEISQSSEPAASDPDEHVAPQPSPPAEIPARAAAVVEAGNAFGIDLYRQLAPRAGNLAISPTSLSLALAMTYAGARGETAAEMRRVLRIEDTDAALHSSAGQLLQAWNDSQRQDAELRVVNRLFGEKAYSFAPEFLERMRETYRAPLDPANFRGDADGERRRINAWVVEQTADRIRDLLPEGSLDRLTRLVLVNAVYFLGQWKHAFVRDDTADAPFHPPRGGPRSVPTMRRTGSHRYADVDGAQILELEYRGEELAMTLVLPNSDKTLASLERGLTASAVSRWIDALSVRRVQVLMPRFEIPDAKVDLGSVLPKLGMRLAFDPNRADFTGMARPANPAEALYITAAFHKAFVKVDEAGTEAAAATAVVMGARGGSPPEPSVFRADRPFLFLIRHVPSGALLFLGRVHDPAG